MSPSYFHINYYLYRKHKDTFDRESFQQQKFYIDSLQQNSRLNECPEYETKLFDDVAPLLELWGCGVPFYRHYFQIHSDPN